MARVQTADPRELHRLAIPLCAAVLGGALAHGSDALILGAWKAVAIDLALVTVTAGTIVLYVRGIGSARSRRAVGVSSATLVVLMAGVFALSMSALAPSPFQIPLGVAAVVFMVACAIAAFRLTWVLGVESVNEAERR